MCRKSVLVGDFISNQYIFSPQLMQIMCGTCHMAYILIFSIFLPSLNNNTIFIFSSYFIKHTLASFFKFLRICATESLPGLYKPPELSQIIQSLTCLHLDNTSPRLVSTFTSTAPGWPMPSRPLLFLYHLALVHQEDCSSSLARSRPLLKNVLTNALSVSSQYFGCHRHLHRNILVAQVTWLLRTCYPSAHPRTCYQSAR